MDRVRVRARARVRTRVRARATGRVWAVGLLVHLDGLLEIGRAVV